MRAALATGLVCGLAASAGYGLQRLDAAYPPPLEIDASLSVEVVDRNGKLLRVFAVPDGRWRLKADLDRIDPHFLRMLIAYEDQRFYSHRGVDPLALGRAAGQLAANGRIVSGGSTITMQLARLFEPREKRSFGVKLRQIARAIQIERRLTKREILERYLTLAPYGGNIEGVRAAALSWFGKEPARLSAAESALLVVLPQSPETRRPDRFAASAKRARDRVMLRLAAGGIVELREARDVAAIGVPVRRLEMPQLAPHLAQAAVDRDPAARIHATRIDRDIQARLEALARDGARRIGPRVSLAIVVADSQTGDILASVGSPGYLDASRGGAIDMTQALRSPGSALKPFIYGLAIEDGLVLPETLIADRPADFSGYRPVNFDQTYQGDISVRRALQMSLNVPAVRLLEAVGPARLAGRLKRIGVKLVQSGDDGPGLALALGGTGLSLTDLVQLYANLAAPGPVAIGDGIRSAPGRLAGPKPLSNAAAWHVIDMLSGIGAPNGSKPLAIAYKTGTSYGYRDAWAAGFDGRHAVGVWIGRTDNGAVPGISGALTAAPLLFEAFEKSGLEPAPMPRAPAGAIRLSAQELPAALRRFDARPFFSGAGRISPASRLHIAFPADGALMEAAVDGAGGPVPVVIKLQGGTPPFQLLADGRPVTDASRTRQLLWTPQGAGTARLTVLDAAGQASNISVVMR